MLVKNLTLENFRNYEKAFFSYSGGINVIKGSNAQGKTNSAEALFLLCTGYSPRVKSDRQVIRYGEERASISASAEGAYGKVKVEICFYKNNKKLVKINDVAVKKVGEILGNINAVFFNPDELKLIKETPEDRRRFMDISICQRDKKYFYALSRYKQILLQRNNLLKDGNRSMIYDTVELWDVQLCSAAAQVILARNAFIEQLAPLCKDAHELITDGKESLEVSRAVKYFGDAEEIAEQLQLKLNSRLDKDIMLGYTTEGPHRDDIKLTVGGEDIRAFGSQGQQRTAALSLKLAELEVFKQHYGEYPLLILDDALSELDRGRQKRLLKRIENVQTVITLTEVDREVFSDVSYTEKIIEGGRIV